MTHPLIPPVTELAALIAEALGLEVVRVVFQPNYNPPVLRLDVRNPAGETSLEDCERMSRSLEPLLDEAGLIPEAYVLEVSSPGIPNELTTDREFSSFKGFPVLVKSSETGHSPEGTTRRLREDLGTLLRRDENFVYLNQKGRTLKIPRAQVTTVQLVESL
jgi:ribosome maturation factor RimP